MSDSSGLTYITVQITELEFWIDESLQKVVWIVNTHRDGPNCSELPRLLALQCFLQSFLQFFQLVADNRKQSKYTERTSVGLGCKQPLTLQLSTKSLWFDSQSVVCVQELSQSVNPLSALVVTNEERVLVALCKMSARDSVTRSLSTETHPSSGPAAQQIRPPRPEPVDCSYSYRECYIRASQSRGTGRGSVARQMS
uniref:Uncharacterized protein n=1 Tax=Timema cristinae TaxID=61476 RepID=A0A7R9D4S7_TIMCR|nr:unnamed protein product [Timema cristinae]